MARRRDSKGGGLILLIGFVIAAVAFLGPFAIALWVLIREGMALRFGGASRAADILASSEREALAHGEAAISDLQARAAAVQARGDKLGLLRRLEGSRFDARNRQARDLNDQLDWIDEQLADLGQRFGEYQSGLFARLEAWLKVRAGQTAARAALVSYIAVFVTVLLHQLGPIGHGVILSRIFVGAEGDGAARTMASFTATVVALLVGWLAGIFKRRSLSA